MAEEPGSQKEEESLPHITLPVTHVVSLLPADWKGSGSLCRWREGGKKGRREGGLIKLACFYPCLPADGETDIFTVGHVWWKGLILERKVSFA